MLSFNAQLRFATMSEHGNRRRCGGEDAATLQQVYVHVVVVVFIPNLGPKLTLPRRLCLILFLLLAFSNRNALPQTVVRSDSGTRRTKTQTQKHMDTRQQHRRAGPSPRRRRAPFWLTKARPARRDGRQHHIYTVIRLP